MRKVLQQLSRVFLLSFLVAPIVFPSIPSSAQSVSPWFAGAPELMDEFSIVSHADYMEVRGKKLGPSAGLECVDKRIAKRSILSINLQYENSCWYNTKVGLLSQYGNYLVQPGGDVAGHIRNTHTDSRLWTTIIPTPNDDVFLEVRPSPAQDGYFLSFRRTEDFVFDRQENILGDVTLTLTTPPTEIVRNSNGSQRKINLGDISWSADAKYMLAYTKNGYLSRYNLENFKSMGMTVADSPTGNLGRGSAAISPSGNYAVAAEERTLGNMYIVDLTSCDYYETEVVTKDSKCLKKSVGSMLRANIPDYRYAGLPRFFGEHTIGFYSYNGPESHDYNLRYLQASGTEFVDNGYLALGDSFSSGEGAGEYIEGTDELIGNRCHTSQNSYPYVINSLMNFTEFYSLACSGARMEHVNREGQYENLDAPNNEPGNHPQLSILANYEPGVASITMSGNDVGFADKLRYCLFSGDCYSTYEKRMEIANEIRSKHLELVDLFGEIKDKSPGIRLYVLGYPQIMADNQFDSCSDNVLFNAYQRQMANQMIKYFNDVIEGAAIHAGAYYVDTEGALSGNMLCEGSSDASAVNGLTLGNDTGPLGIPIISNGSFHPNTYGHLMLANDLLEKTNNLSVEMPNPNPDYPLPNPEDYEFTNAAKSGEVIYSLKYNGFGNIPVVKAATSFSLSINNPLYRLKAFVEYVLELQSEPTSLGTVMSDGAGNISADIQIPDSVKPGMHALHVRGLDEDDKPIDVYSYVYVSASDIDFDGDGVLNEDEPCGMFEPSGNDIDGDGIDDACDPLIGKRISAEEPTVDEQSKNIKPVILGSASKNTPGSNHSTPSPSYDPVSELLGLSNKDELSPVKQLFQQEPENKVKSEQWYMFVAITLMFILGYIIYSYGRKKADQV